VIISAAWDPSENIGPEWKTRSQMVRVPHLSFAAQGICGIIQFSWPEGQLVLSVGLARETQTGVGVQEGRWRAGAGGVEKGHLVFGTPVENFCKRFYRKKLAAKR
jgi:hypothetical protein